MLMFLSSLVLSLVRLVKMALIAIMFFYLVFVVGWLVLCAFIFQNASTK